MQKTKISPSWLTPVEQKGLERRGFLVTKDFRASGLMWLIINIVLYLSDSFFTFILFTLFVYFIWTSTLGNGDQIYKDVFFMKYIFLIMISLFFLVKVDFFMPIWKFIKIYLNSWFTFYGSNGIISLGELDMTNNRINEITHFFNRNSKWARFFLNNINPIFIVIIFSIIGFFSMFWYFFLWLIYSILWMLIWFFLLEFFRKIYQSFTPLYVFWNLWSKIQSLTPRISESSEKIQNEFSTDMNFSVLSKWFATLASDFSKISGYVLKLEKIEKWANKWNLFDSEKYIDSLREDILTPLITLKKFFEQKKIELEASREELKSIKNQRQRAQVQLGWSDMLIGNSDLQSKRTRPLIHELTKNIEKLDTMIEKFEKV